MSTQYSINVEANTRYISEQSDPASNRFVFAYHITISNIGSISAQLLSRHWIITSGNQRIQEVKGEGVVGQQPTIAPGEQHDYTSYAVIDSPVGSMEGSYQMQADDGHCFDTPIGPFSLAMPHILN